MINWGEGFFLGLKFGFVLIVLSIEFYFLVLDKYTEGDISKIEFTVLSITSGLCIILSVVQLTKFSLGLWPVIPVPVFYVVFRIFEHIEVEKADTTHKNNDIRSLEKVIAGKPEIPETYIALGDIYFKHNDYVKAIQYYRKSYSIKETAEVKQKIKIAEKEYRIQKGEIWVCSECGTDNPSSSIVCKSCGNSNKPVVSIKKDIVENKQEIKKWIIMGFGIPFGALLLLVLIKSFLPSTVFLFLSICLALGVIYILLKKFYTW